MNKSDISDDSYMKEIEVSLNKNSKRNKCVNKKKIKQILNAHYGAHKDLNNKED